MITRSALGLLALLTLFLASCEKDDPKPAPAPGHKTPFENVPLTEDVVMYEVNLRAFSSGGDLQGVIERLDAIKDMGVNTIWLMPIYPVGQVNSINSPYCIRDYREVSTEYGDLSKLRELTTKAHEKGMAVILDWVANHTAWDHPWITTHSDWYTKDNMGRIVHPPGTNWTDVADLNYDKTEMRAEMIASMKYWMQQANVDGFRCDYADGVPFDFWQQAIDTLRRLPDRDILMFAEGNRPDHFAAGFDMAFGWNFYGALKGVWEGQSTTTIESAHTEEYNGTPSGKHWVRFTTNHDESAWDATPMVNFDGVDGALAASAIAIFSDGVPLIYGGQEVGTIGPVPFFSNSTTDWSANPAMLEKYEEMLNFYSSTEVARTGARSVYATDDVYALQRGLNGEDFLLIVNVRSTPRNFNIPFGLQNSVWTDVSSNQSVSLTSSLSLDGYEVLILVGG